MAERRAGASKEDAAQRAWSAMGDLVLDNQRRREVSDALGMSFGRIRAIRRLARSPMTMGKLANMLGIDAPYATLVVDELESQGLVERRSDPTDRRVRLVAATAAGAAVARQANEIMGRPPAGLAGLSGPELKELARLLELAAAPTVD
jgi:DNA-binding MarR family transcriptional regulator